MIKKNKYVTLVFHLKFQDRFFEQTHYKCYFGRIFFKYEPYHAKYYMFRDHPNEIIRTDHLEPTGLLSRYQFVR